METLLSGTECCLSESPVWKELAVRYLRSFHAVLGYIVIALATIPFKDVYTLDDVAKFWKAYRDGILEKLGKL